MARDASPVTHVAKDAPAFLILHGTADPLVPIAQSEELADRLKAAGAAVQFAAVPGAGHAGAAFWTEALRGRMVAFLKAHLV